MPHEIFEDWDDYENLKKKDDIDFFSCSTKWEVKYLKEKIKQHYPTIPAKDIANAIDHCCKTASPPYPRKLFVKYVMGQLGVRIN